MAGEQPLVSRLRAVIAAKDEQVSVLPCLRLPGPCLRFLTSPSRITIRSPNHLASRHARHIEPGNTQATPATSSRLDLTARPADRTISQPGERDRTGHLVTGPRDEWTPGLARAAKRGPAPGGPILISSDRGHLWRQLAARFGLADPDPGAPLEDKAARPARDITEWIAGHQDRVTLKRDLEARRLRCVDTFPSYP